MVAVFEPEPKNRGKNAKQELPSSNITPGDIVGVGLTNSDPTDKPLTSGIVLQMSASNVSVAFDDSQDILDLDDSASYKLTKLANDVTYRRLKVNLNDLLKYRDGPARKLIDTLFSLDEVSGPGGEFPFTFVNGGLDESQREAVKFALTQREVAIIHGPPGTGKTTTVVEIILQSVAQGLKALEAACWIGLLRGQRCILAGDHLQLPPTIMSKEAASSGLELTLMERLLATLVKEKERDIVRMLTTQYRMHQDIMEWASHQLYQGKLMAHTSVATHLLKDLEGVSDTEETRVPLLLIDTAGCDLQELDLPEEVSKGNEGEADVVACHVESLIKAGVKSVDIAVIAPYNMQGNVTEFTLKRGLYRVPFRCLLLFKATHYTLSLAAIDFVNHVVFN
ncbi:DNA-binding protein SMUBP-2 [Elysia marginata]|uniref:DNA helicase n=1 Tax=Elysia marginata TaxID=1093978 RepID=A0AAV4J6H0_9GAST|nr:DNA-binding protein SMUBP-2 [Elysia marginata]